MTEMSDRGVPAGRVTGGTASATGTRRWRLRWVAMLAALGLLAAACSSDSGSGASGSGASGGDSTPSATSGDEAVTGFDPDADRGGGRVDLEAASVATFDVGVGVGTVTVTGAASGARLTLLTASGVRMVSGRADEDGQLHVAYVPDRYVDAAGRALHEVMESESGTSLSPGTYRVALEAAEDDTGDPAEVQVSEPLEVLGRDDVPADDAFYDQGLTESCEDFDAERRCYTYIEARDGVMLSATVRLPNAEVWGDGPYPTVIEYSGYGPSRPEGAGEPGSMIAGLLGYASVGVNMRGSGCSGGVFDTFNPAQQADGYDIVEVVAREPWVLHGRPGMVGLSYSGITQLYTAATRPPSLAAVTPLSVIEDPWSQQWPGGLYNQGFTRSWLSERDAQNAPGGDGWVEARVEGGDEQCAANLELRGQSPDFEAFGRSLEFRPPDADDRRLGWLVSDIEVPVYLTGAWQDEQTGSSFATMLDRFDNAEVTRFILFNGHHPDGYSPMVLTRWYEFLELYVARRTPELPDEIIAASAAVFAGEFGVEQGFEENRFAGLDYEEALARFEAEDPVRVLFEAGWGLPDIPGGQQPTFDVGFASWPPPALEATRWYLGPDGALGDGVGDVDGADRWRHDPEAGELTYTDAGSGAFQQPLVEFDWPNPPAGSAVTYVTEPLPVDTILTGPGHLAVWVRPGAEDAGIEVTLAEVRPDGVEMRVQGGWLRLGHRVLDERLSDDLRIEHTFLREDFTSLEVGEWVEVQVPIHPFAHPMRSGSRLALRIDTPGRDMPFWAFSNPEDEVAAAAGDEGLWHAAGWGPARPSALVLGRLTVEVDVPDSLPPCPSLRGQVCRDWQPLANEPADVD
jgi:uncharacterized protein